MMKNTYKNIFILKVYVKSKIILKKTQNEKRGNRYHLNIAKTLAFIISKTIIPVLFKEKLKFN